MQKPHRMSKAHLVEEVVRGGREFSTGTVLFHQAVGQMLGVNVTDMKCLDRMTLKGTVSPRELAELTGLSSGATTAVIDRLERAGMVQRRPHPTDRRGTTLVLTEEAQRKLPRLFASLGQAMTRLVSSYSRSELEVLTDFFDRVSLLWREERQKLRARGF